MSELFKTSARAIRSFSENPVQHAFGLAMECPLQNRAPDCPLHTFEDLTPLQKFRALQRTSASKLAELLQHHTNCMAEKEVSFNKEAGLAPKPGLSVLLAEDDPHTRLSLEMALRRRGYSVLAAESADQALEIIRQIAENKRRMIDVLVTDLNMPEKRGDQLIAELDALGQELPVVLITAYGSNELEARLYKRSNVTVLNKPFHPDDLAEAITEIYTRKLIKEGDYTHA